MPQILELIDRYTRRNSSLPRMQWLRNVLRKPYHQLLKRSEKGLTLNIVNAMSVRLPGEFCAKELEQYEAESAEAIRDWSVSHPGGLFVDIGCSYGYFSCGVLFTDPKATVIAIDADLPSLAITKYICKFADGVDKRLEIYRTLIGPESSSKKSPVILREETSQLLEDPGLTLDPKTTNYVNLDTKISEENLTRISLDDFLGERLRDENVPCMIKCDVEGAELLVLRGAKQILKDRKPTLLISVHPPFLPDFDSTVEEIQTLLTDAGYEIDVIAIDHEEHWLCQ